jgi:HEAT repeat protein
MMALVLAAFFSLFEEPHYRCRSLSYWIMLNADNWSRGRGVEPKAEEAIAHIGTNALPFLLNWIRYEPQPSRIRTAAISFFSRKLPKAITPDVIVRWVCEDKAGSRANAAAFGFCLLGPQIRSALPELFRLMNDRSSTNISPQPQLAPCERAELALLYSRNDDAIPLFLAHIANTNAPNRAEVVFLVGLYDLTTNAGPAVPMLIQCLIDNDPEVIKEAARALTKCDLKPGLILPALTNCLGNSTNPLLRSRAIWVLGNFKPQVRLTQPFLIAALQDPDANVRKQATNALLKIAPEAFINTPTQ